MRNKLYDGLPTVIYEPGLYVTRQGFIVDIYEISDYHSMAYGRFWDQDISDFWDISGRQNPFNESRFDIVRKE